MEKRLQETEFKLSSKEIVKKKTILNPAPQKRKKMEIMDLKEDSRHQRKQPRIGNRKLKSLENTANKNVDIIRVVENF